MNDYTYPKTFDELIDTMLAMEFNQWVENEDSGKEKLIVIGNMVGGKYEMYEDKEFIGCTGDIIKAACFIAEGWEPYERMRAL